MCKCTLQVVEGSSEEKGGEGGDTCGVSKVDIDDNLQNELCKLWDMSMTMVHDYLQYIALCAVLVAVSH